MLAAAGLIAALHILILICLCIYAALIHISSHRQLPPNPSNPSYFYIRPYASKFSPRAMLAARSARGSRDFPLLALTRKTLGFLGFLGFDPVSP